ncbi:MAG: ChbG/HpnK family deacetylase [Gemmatimonadaceae bacterium]|nr:ChbG/HpnK family deacetylase [Gemmatimonadaceae bacterium]NUQ94355.1 ChbG/HpnK family deacetylase [Gemmatimonadaceae bacterium]NUR35486.1 ChbG/HpnK family deacetylase [Gemmatimonadaceae bacterium]
MHRLCAFTLACCTLLSSLPADRAGQGDGSRRAGSADPVYLLVRSDDGGMSHSVNMGLKRLIESGIPVSVSVMWGTPWYQETVDLLRQHPEVAVGVHLTLNSEWKNLRWGPVLGQRAVPTLVDSLGLFFPTSEALHDHHPDLKEVEAELRAQIDRAKRSGLKIDYLDYHMGTVSRYPEFREIAERLAKEYGVGLSGYFGEGNNAPQYDVPPAAKADTLIALVNRLNPRFNLLVTHVGIDDAELGALIDMNTDGGLAEMSRNRQGELDALTAGRFRDALRARNVRLITYRQLIEMQGLQSMRRPGGGG